MTVAELILALKKLDQQLPVEAEGCDCINPVVSAEEITFGAILKRPARTVVLLRVEL